MFVLLISNQVTKYNFWTPHDQILNLLTPLLCLFIGIRFKKYIQNLKNTTLFSAISGSLVLLYGSFLLVLPLIIFCYWATKKRIPQIIIFDTILIITAFFFPTFLWCIILKAQGVNFFSAEISIFRQFVWILDAMKGSGSFFLSALLKHTASFIKTLPSLIFLTILLIGIAWRAHNNLIKSVIQRWHKKDYDDIFVLAAFIVAEFLLFYWALGYYADRLTFSIAPILICCIAACLKKEKINQRFKYLLLLIIVLSHIYTIFYHPLYFPTTFFS
ncbi:MAG TPA: hypothetical protein VMT76_09980 [Puia sp.]|nr:hypothetical protein [Puia sp.]